MNATPSEQDDARGKAQGGRPSGVFTAEHELFRATVRRFISKEIEPHYREWERLACGVPKELWRRAGELGLLGTAIPEAHGGVGGDPLYSVVHAQEIARSEAGAAVGSLLETDMLTDSLVHFGTEQQKQRWFPRILAGAMQAFALTEPAGGSDVFTMRTRARQAGDDYLISGQKAYITNGLEADIIYVIAKTDTDAVGPRHNMTMFVVDGEAAGLQRRRMETMGIKAQAIAELFFDDVRVPKSAIVGEEGGALTKILPSFFPYDRTLSSVRALGAARLAFDLTVEHTRTRRVFGRRVLDFQNSQFKLAEIKATLLVGQSFMDDVLRKLAVRELDEVTASAAKYWFANTSFQIATECLQLHGGYGYMSESAISRLFTFTRLGSIYAGTSELQKKLIARSFL